MDPHLDATAQAELVRSGEATARELAEGAIERIEALNGEAERGHPSAVRARRWRPSRPTGPSSGVPFVVKDLARAVKDDAAPRGDALPARPGLPRRRRLVGWRRAFAQMGFVFVGKTNTPELGILPTTEPEAYGPSRNPWDTNHSPGGSSGGSALGRGVGHGLDRARRRRRRLDPHPGVVLRAGRAEGQRARGCRWRRSATSSAAWRPSSWCARSVRDTAAVLDVRRPRGAPASPTPASEGAALHRGGRGRPGQAAHRADDGDSPGHWSRGPGVRGGRRVGGSVLESLGHSVDVAHPAALDDEGYDRAVPGALDARASPPGSTSGACAPASRSPRTTWSRRTWALAEQGWSNSAAALVDGDRLLRRSWRAACWPGGRTIDLLLTPTMALPPRGAGGRSETGTKRPAGADRARGALRGVHGRVQRDRAAGDLAAAALVGGRAADRGAAGGRPGRRGPAAAGRGAAGAGAAVGGAAAPAFAAA